VEGHLALPGDMMKTIIYDLQITTDIVHGWTNVIRELCVASLGLFINQECAFLLNKKDTQSRLSKRKNVTVMNSNKKQSAVLKRLATATKQKDDLFKQIQERWFGSGD
jgi:hypothetical protein